MAVVFVVLGELSLPLLFADDVFIFVLGLPRWIWDRSV